MALYTLKTQQDMARMLNAPKYNPNSTTMYNALGRDAGAAAAQDQNPNFFQKKWNSAKNSVGTTLAAGASLAKDIAENAGTYDLLRSNKYKMNDVYKQFGFSGRDDYEKQLDEAEKAGNDQEVQRLLNLPGLQEALQKQANSNADVANKKAAEYTDWRKNNYVSNKINQDNTKFAGSAINTLSTGLDLTGIAANPLANAVQGGVEGFADEMEANGGNVDLTRLFSNGVQVTGGENFDWGRAAQNAAIGATTGAVTGALNKGLSSSLAKNGGSLFKGGNAFTRGLNNLGSKTALGRIGSTLATGATRGALSGAVGGATGAGLSSAINGVDINQGLQNTLQGALQGAQQGAVTGGIMAGANMAISKTPGVGKFYNELQSVKPRWDQSGKNFNERLTNTLTSGDSAVGDWLMNKRQSKVLGTAGNLGNSIQDVSGYSNLPPDMQTRIDIAKANGATESEIDSAIRSAIRADNLSYSGRYADYDPAVDDYSRIMKKYGADLDLVDERNWNATQRQAMNAYNNTRKANLDSDWNNLGAPTTASSDNIRNRVQDVSARTGRYYDDVEEYNPELYKALNSTDHLGEQNDLIYAARQKLVDEMRSKGATTQQDLDFNPEYGLYRQLEMDNIAQQYGFNDFSDAIDQYRVQSGTNKLPRYDTVENWMMANRTRNQTPTTAKGWAKKAGQRIVEDVNNSNLGNRIKDVSSDIPEDIRNMRIRDYNANADGGVDTTYGIASDPRVRQQLLANVNAQLAENPNARIGDTNFDADAIISEYSDRLTPEQYRDFNPTDAENALVQELQSLEASQGFARPNSRQITQTTQVDPWDRVAQEAGYRNYDEVLQRYAEANPNAKVNPRGMAGEVLTWLDQNPNTPQTAGDWAKLTGKRIVEDANNRGVGLGIKDVSDDPSKRLYNALTGNQEPIAEAEEVTTAGPVPSKTSRESRLRYAQGKELLRQYGTVDAPMARATNAVKTFQDLYDMGFEKPADVEVISNAITGSNGYVSTLNKNIIKTAQPVDTYAGASSSQTIDDFIDNSIEHNMLSGTNEGVAVKRGINAYLKSLPSRAEGSIDYTDTAADTFKVIQGLEARAAELEGRGGSTYHRATTADLHQAAVLKDVASLLKDRVYDGANVKVAITPQVVKEMKALSPGNEKWAATVDDFAANAKTPQDLRSFQAPFVRAGRYIDNQYVQAATVGGRMASNAGELPETLRTTKAGIINDLVNRAWNSNAAHRGRAALYGRLADKAAEKSADTPTTAKDWTKKAGQRVAEDLGNTNLGNRIQDVSGQPINSQAAAPTEQASVVSNYNPATQLYNALGRNEGLTSGENVTAQKYLNAAVQGNASDGYMDPLGATTSTYGAESLEDLISGTPSSNSVYNSVYGSPAQASGNKYFQPTGDYWTDVLGDAVALALDANDEDAFATLYSMYQNSAANLAKNTTSASQVKLTDKQRQANAAADALADFEQAESNFGYDVSDIPVLGAIANIGGNDYTSRAEALATQVGYMLSGATINKDEAKKIGTSYVPQPRDSEAVRQSKINRLRGIISDYQQTYSE